MPLLISLKSVSVAMANEGHGQMIMMLRCEVLYPESFKHYEVECQLYADPRLQQDIALSKGIGSMTASGTRLTA